MTQRSDATLRTLRRVVSGGIASRTRNLSTPARNQLTVAKQSMTYSCLALICLGGPDHYQSADIIARLSGAIVCIDADCTCDTGGPASDPA